MCDQNLVVLQNLVENRLWHLGGDVVTNIHRYYFIDVD